MNDERTAQRAALLAQASAIAKALAAKVTNESDPEHWTPSAIVTLSDGTALDVAPAYQEKGKLRICVSLPAYTERDGSKRHQSVNDLLTYEEKNHAATPCPVTDIKVSAEKTPERIAADITRRLIPGATLLTLRARERKATAEAFGKGVNQTLAMITKATRASARGTTVHADGLSLEVSSPDSVRLGSFYVKPETAVEIWKLVKRDNK